MRSLIVCVLLFVANCGLNTPGPGPNNGAKPRPTDEPALSAIIPNTGFRNRLVELQITAVNTHFEAGTLVDFDDPEIKLAFTYQSSVNLQVYANIGGAARLGPHDVTVTTLGPTPDEPVKIVLKGGFTVLSALAFESTSAEAAQGGLVNLTVLNRDFRDTPLQTSSITIKEGPLLLDLQGATAYRYSWRGLIDALVTPGPLQVELQGRSPLGELVSYDTSPTDPHAGNVQIRAATILTPGLPLPRQQLASSNQTNLYSITASDSDRVLMVTYSNAGVGLLLDGLVTITAPASGRFRDGQRIALPSLHETTYTALALLPHGGMTYFAVFPGSFGGAPDSYAYEISARTAAAQQVDLAERTPDGPAQPLLSAMLDGPIYSESGAIEPASDNDYIKFVPSHAGRVFAQATGTQAYSLKITFYQNDCATQLGPGRGFQQEADVNAGIEYCVRLSAAAATPYRFILSPML